MSKKIKIIQIYFIRVDKIPEIEKKISVLLEIDPKSWKCIYEHFKILPNNRKNGLPSQTESKIAYIVVFPKPNQNSIQ